MSAQKERFDPIVAEKMASFHRAKVEHAVLKELRECCTAEILYRQEPRIIVVAGASGAGKTTLAHRICQDMEECFDPAKEKPDRVPYLRVEAVSPEKGNFSWADFNRRLLIAANEILVDKKVLVEKRLSKEPYRAGDTAEALRISAQKMVEHRNPYVLVVDEAHSFLRVVTGRRVLDQGEILKGILNLARVPILLLGVPEILQIASPSGQISRRMKVLFFRGYRAENERDMKEFRGALKYFQDRLPLDEQVDLMPYWRDIYGLSLGLIGLLKDIMLDALLVALTSGRKTLQYKDLEREALSDPRRDDIIKELRDCERAMREDARKSPATSAAQLNAPFTLSEGDDVSGTKPKKGKGRRVGKRKPGGDPVGDGPNGDIRRAEGDDEDRE